MTLTEWTEQYLIFCEHEYEESVDAMVWTIVFYDPSDAVKHVAQDSQGNLSEAIFKAYRRWVENNPDLDTNPEAKMGKQADELERLMNVHNETLVTLAHNAGVDFNSLFAALTGGPQVSFEEAKKLARYFGVPINLIMPYEDQEPIDNPFESAAIIVSPCGIGGNASDDEVDLWKRRQALSELVRLSQEMELYDDQESIE
jgi:transcriptional regulator with XRE-family HTH domain